MLTLMLRTDKPETEVGLYNNDEQLAYYTWQAHRQLAETIHLTIKQLLDEHQKDWHDIQGIVFYKGPGSFTGLRIGTAVANTLASELSASIVGETGEDWIAQGLNRLQKQENDKLVQPEYGAAPHITQQKK